MNFNFQKKLIFSVIKPLALRHLALRLFAIYFFAGCLLIGAFPVANSLSGTAFADLNEVSVTSPVDAQKNANLHNRRGVSYFKEQDYFAALKEFKIAIAINPNSQSTAVYYNNLGKVYLIFGEIQRSRNLTRVDADFSEMAKTCFERAIMQDCMKFEYYKNLVTSYELLGISKSKKDFLLKNLNINPFNAIIVAIILAKEGNYDPAIILLTNFAKQNPDLIITDDVKKFITALETANPQGL